MKLKLNKENNIDLEVQLCLMKLEFDLAEEMYNTLGTEFKDLNLKLIEKETSYIKKSNDYENLEKELNLVIHECNKILQEKTEFENQYEEIKLQNKDLNKILFIYQDNLGQLEEQKTKLIEEISLIKRSYESDIDSTNVLRSILTTSESHLNNSIQEILKCQGEKAIGDSVSTTDYEGYLDF